METEGLSKESQDINNEIHTPESRREGSAKAPSTTNTTASHMSLAQRLKGRGDPPAPQGKTGGGGSGIGALMMMKRKLNRWKMGRSSNWSTGSRDRAPPKLENTFRMEPRDNDRFNCQEVQNAIEEVVKFYTANMKEYNAQKCASVSRYIAEEIKSKIKQLGFSRYKIVTNVIVGQDRDHGLQVSSRCVWDTKNDDMVSFTLKRNDLYVLATVYGIYFE